MNILNNLRRKLAEWLLKSTPDEAYESTLLRGSGPWTIWDGIDRTLPIPVPARIREQGQQVVESYLTARLEEAKAVFQHQFDTPYQTSTPWKMLGTDDPLAEWDWTTRRDILERCHLLWERDPLANTAISYTRLFAVQNGMNIKYRNQDVKEVLEDFINNPENAVREQEKTMCDSLLVDGELFIRFNQGDGMNGEPGDVVISPLLPWGVRWIKHEVGFVRRTVEYEYEVTQDDGTGSNAKSEREAIAAGEVLHVAINRMWYEQRGRPELFRIIPWLRAYKEWLENRARQNYWKGAIIGHLKLTGANPGQVSAKRAQYKEPPNPGSLLISNDKEDLNYFTTPVGASDAGEDGRQIKLQSAAGMRLAEYFLSDGSNANLASATAQQLPALRSFGEMQDIMAEQVWTPIFKRVIQAAIEADVLPEEVPQQDADGEAVEDTEQIKAEDAFEVSYPSLDEEDPKNIAEALQIAVMNGWISNETAAGMLPWPIDYQVEQRKIEAERQAEMNDPYRQPGPFGVPGQPGQPPQGQPQGQEPESQDVNNTTN